MIAFSVMACHTVMRFFRAGTNESPRPRVIEFGRCSSGRTRVGARGFQSRSGHNVARPSRNINYFCHRCSRSEVRAVAAAATSTADEAVAEAAASTADEAVAKGAFTADEAMAKVTSTADEAALLSRRQRQLVSVGVTFLVLIFFMLPM